jgi:hypothetical protein
VRRFEFLQTAGIGTAQHLQLPLREVFVEPQGVLERHGGVKWSTRGEELRALLEDRRRNREISPEEYEAQLDRLAVEEGLGATAQEEKVAVAEVVRQSERVVVLGDPGTGKTTLLRYLALRHAQALLDREATVSPALGEARMPLYIRAGDFARSQQRDAGVRAFIVPFLAMTLQCPVKAEHLEGLIDRRLRAGRALVLIDGLDEVTTAQDRAIVVENISNFVGAQQPRGNRFICTSRISGYPAAPLPPEFQAVRLLEMTDASIEQFLNQYVPAIEHAEATKKSSAIAHQDAKRTIQELLNAFAASPGVRRLATNPLLLTALLLVHRTHGALPERRVDAYKAVTDALGHTWRVKQGVPELELPDERRLTQWLTRLADWMHAHRPEGSATVRDLLDQWGPLWARLQREPWNPDVLDAADPAATDAGSAILAFVAQVEQHTGLLVERAPRRWGFPHLTFEEFYAGRALAFEGRASDRAKRIREHLHDARYDEPILLALGLLGRDQPEELERIFEAAILAQGEDADSLGLQPNEGEELLGRDFRFALRALADDIPASPALVDALLEQAINEVLDTASRGRFTSYRGSLLERVRDLTGLSAGARAAQLLAQRASKEPFTDGEQCRRFVEFAGSCPQHPSIAERLTVIIATSDDSDTAIRAADVLAGVGELPAATLQRLTEIIATSENPSAVIGAADVLARVGELPAATLQRLTEITATSENPNAVMRAAHLLTRVGELPADVVEALAAFADSDADWLTRRDVVKAIAQSGPSVFVIDVLLQRLMDEDTNVREAAGNGLADLASNYPEWRDKIAEALKDAAHDAYALFANRDRVEGRAASDYAYDALWRLTELEASSASRTYAR